MEYIGGQQLGGVRLVERGGGMHWFTCNDAARRVGGVNVGGSLPRAGRAFLYFGDSSRVRAGWSFFNNLNWLEARVHLDLEDGLTLSLTVPWLAHLYAGVSLPNRWLRSWMIDDRVFSLKFGYVGHLVDVEVAWAQWAEDCGMTDYYRRQSPRAHTDAQLWRGWRWKLRRPPLLRWLLGREQYEEVVLDSKPIVVEMDGRRYEGTWKLERYARTRPRWRWPYGVSVGSHVVMPDPPRFAGKGENSWDCGDDGIFGMGSREVTPAGAVGDYVKAVLKRRERYGMPGEYA